MPLRPVCSTGRATIVPGRVGSASQAAFSQAAVSKALHIIGMFMPKLGFGPFFGTATFAAGLTVFAGATSVARSHDPISWERATEKNRST